MEFGILLAARAAVVTWSIFSYHDDDNIDDDSFRRRFFFFFAVRLSWPLSVFESSLSDSLDELELDDDDDELELLELSDANPVASFKFTFSAISANSGSFSYRKIETITIKCVHIPFNMSKLLTFWLKRTFQYKIQKFFKQIENISMKLPWVLEAIFSTTLVDREPFCAKQWENLFCCRNFVSQLSYHLNLTPHANSQVARKPFLRVFVKFQWVDNL